MKIVHIIPTLSAGGAERMISNLCIYDNDNQHIVITLLKHKKHYNLGDAKVINLNLKNNLMTKIFIISKLCQLIKTFKPDLVQTWMNTNLYGPLIKLYTGKPIVSNFRNGYIGKKNYFQIKLMNNYYKSFDAHIFVSISAYQERIKNGLKFEDYIIIQNGFEVKGKLKKKKNDFFTIGHLGRYAEIKNQQLIIDGFREFSKTKKNVKLLMAGRNLNDKTLDTNNLLHHKIEFYDEIKDVNSFYDKLDLFILTSKSEGFPNVIGEAMSNGVPVLASDAGESFEIIGEAGYKLLNPNKIELSNLLNYIYINQDELTNYRTKSYNRIKNEFSIESTINKYKTYYGKVVKK